MPKSIPKKVKTHKALFPIVLNLSCQKKTQKKPIKMISFSQNDKFTSRFIHNHIFNLDYPTERELKVKSYKLGFKS